uniref:VWFA domain-containing protein n=1 Tax=Meloidogyne incognita TaxID=6306 RepID=A0A914MHJ1_MELIC
MTRKIKQKRDALLLRCISFWTKNKVKNEDAGFPPPPPPTTKTTTSPTPVVVISQQQEQQSIHSPPSPQPPQPYLLLQQPLISPQSGGSITTDEEEEEYDEGREGQTNIRISLFSNNGDGDGMSTTADDIEFVPRGSTQYQKVETTKIQEQLKQQQNQHHPLNAEEAKQVAALLQEYETPTTATIELEKHKQIEEERQKYSKKIKTTREEEIISLPESAKQTPGGSISIPESPASLGFDIISFPQSPIEKETAQTDDTVIIETTEINLNIQQQKQQPEQSLEQQKLATVVFPSSQSQVASTYLQQQSPQTKPPTSPIKHQTAESLLQEAIDYMQQQEGHLPLREQQQQKQQKRISLRQSGEFVMEEEMLESEEIPGGPPVIIHSRQKGTPVFGRKSSKELTEIDKNKTAMAVLSPSSPQGLLAESAGGSTPGADGTSKQIVTNEVFDKPDPILLFEDGDDDITHAPEIQSMEIPPDQLSQADSLNLVDENFSEHQELGGGGGATTTNLELKRQLSEPQQTQIPPPKPPRTSLHFEDNEMAEILKQQKLEEDSKNFVGQTEEKKHQQQIFTQNTELNKQDEQIIVLPPHPPEYQQQQKQIIYPDQKQNPQAPQFLLRSTFTDDSISSLDTTVTTLRFSSIRQSSLLSVVGVTSTQEMLLKLQSLEALSEAMRKAGLESSNLIFGIDYTASNKYQGERSFNGRSLHSVDDKGIENPYQQVIKIMGRTLAPFAGTQYGIPAFGFGDASTGDWSVFSLNGTSEGECNDLDDVLRIYNQVTPKVDLSGPTNFAPLIYRSMEICYARKDYHILVIIADGQVTNERATRKAIVAACQYPLSIIVVGVGDGPWDMMKVFDESLPKRPWDNFHFVEFHSLFTDENMNQQSSSKELSFAINSLLEIPDQAKLLLKCLENIF